MKTFHTLAAISLLTIVPASNAQQNPPASGNAHLGRILRVSANVAGGYGGGYDYKVQIDRSGDVTYTGGRGAVRGVHKAHIPPARFRSLIKELERQGIYRFTYPDEVGPLGDSVVRYVDIVGEHGSSGTSSFHDSTGKATLYESLVAQAAGVDRWFRGTYEVIALLDAEGFSLDHLDSDTLQRLWADSAAHKDMRTCKRIQAILQKKEND